MSRLEEVEAEIDAILRKTKRPQLAAAALARTLAAENAELQRRLDAICNWIDTNNDNGAGEAIYAIAEGRDNG